MADNTPEAIFHQHVEKAAQRIYDLHMSRKSHGDGNSTRDTTRTMVSLVGIPGSGKTTLARLIADAVARRLGGGGKTPKNAAVAVALPMDGFHKYRSELDQMPDPKLAHDRRGAPFTFDAVKLAAALERVKTNTVTSFKLPDFDHSLRDPTEGAFTVSPETEVCVWEGLYLSTTGALSGVSDPIERAAWDRIVATFDLRVFLDVDVREAMERLVQRHMAAWGFTWERAMYRAMMNDYANARDHVLPGKETAHIVIPSVKVNLSKL
eukprot:PhM_4_TR13967/c0_g1_i1/m.91666